MAVSGNIGDSIRFEITDATSVTGVKFGMVKLILIKYLKA